MKVVVVGMARSGLAVSRLLRGKGIEVFASDVQRDPPLQPDFEREGIECETGHHSVERFENADEVVVSPGVPLDIDPLQSSRRRGIPVVSELEVAARYLEGDVVALTGSNGKTTTTALVGHILASGSRPVQVGGNIGTPASALVASSRVETINVIEVSSFQLDGIQRFRPHVAVLLNIAPDHMDRYENFEAYRRSKFRVFANQNEDDYAVINRDDDNVFPLPASVRSRHLEFSRRSSAGSGASVRDGQLIVGPMPVMPVVDVPLRGAHNVENVLAGLLVARIYGISAGESARAVESFQPVEHRLEPVATVQGVEYVNDSKATNVDSAVKALESFSEPIVVILGGKDKGVPLEPLVEAMKGKVRQAVLIGASASHFEKAIGGAVPCRRAGSMSEAVEAAAGAARTGDVVLLSPACASFDMYRNYEERGGDFKRAVKSFQN